MIRCGPPCNLLIWTLTRDGAQQRSYSAWFSRFDQPDPYGGSYDLTDPQSFNRYSYVQGEPVNFVDPSGLNLEAPGGRSRPSSLQHGPGFWSPGFHGYDGPSEFPIYYTIWSDGSMTTKFQLFVNVGGPFNLGYFVEGGAGSVYPVFDVGGGGAERSQMPAPIKLPPLPFLKCFNSYKFSSNFTGTLRTIVENVEIGSEISLASDLIAMKRKSTRTGIAGPRNTSASGLNQLFRRVGKPTIKVGDKVSPVLGVIGAFTGGYNLSVAVQCGLGVLN